MPAPMPAAMPLLRLAMTRRCSTVTEQFPPSGLGTSCSDRTRTHRCGFVACFSPRPPASWRRWSRPAAPSPVISAGSSRCATDFAAPRGVRRRFGTSTTTPGRAQRPDDRRERSRSVRRVQPCQAGDRLAQPNLGRDHRHHDHPDRASLPIACPRPAGQPTSVERA